MTFDAFVLAVSIFALICSIAGQVYVVRTNRRIRRMRGQR